jgi:pseudaminic acid synthase
MVKSIREAESAIGVVDYTLTEKQAKGKDFSRSLYVVEDIKKGEMITEQNVRSIRPGFGLHPKYYNDHINVHQIHQIRHHLSFHHFII